MWRQSILAGLSVVFLATTASRSEGNLILNGGFEVPVTGSFTTLTGSGLTDWNIVSGSVDVVTAAFFDVVPPTFAEGLQVLDLNGDTPGIIEQPFTTTAGTLYNFSFQYSSNYQGNSPTPKTALWSISNAVLTTNGILVHGTSTPADFDWQVVTGSFVADNSGTSTIRFESVDLFPFFGIVLDDVVVAAVPEASSFLFGASLLSAVGITVAIRKRRATQVA